MRCGAAQKLIFHQLHIRRGGGQTQREAKTREGGSSCSCLTNSKTKGEIFVEFLKYGFICCPADSSVSEEAIEMNPGLKRLKHLEMNPGLKRLRLLQLDALITRLDLIHNLG
jgi:hypothetical protein